VSPLVRQLGMVGPALPGLAGEAIFLAPRADQGTLLITGRHDHQKHALNCAVDAGTLPTTHPEADVFQPRP